MAYDELRQQLEDRLASLQERLDKVKRDVSATHSVDSAEQAQERENDEVMDVIGHETAQSIREIRAALERIEDGTYGTCQVCGEEIAEGRLRALPEATRCVDCADKK